MLLAALLTASGTVSPPAGAGADTDPHDWILLKITGGPEGATGVLGQGLFFGGTDSERTILASGVGGEHVSGDIFVWDSYGGGPTEARTSNGLGGFKVVLMEGRKYHPVGGGKRYQFQAIEPGETVAFLMFGVGWESLELTVPPPNVETGSVTLEIQKGTGSGLLSLHEPASKGMGVAAAGRSVGSSQDRFSSADGIAGAITITSLCLGSGQWEDPQGHSASFERGWNEHLRHDHTFAGPAGEWSWSWEGVCAGGADAFGAWAPIGDDWPLFSLQE